MGCEACREGASYETVGSRCGDRRSHRRHCHQTARDDQRRGLHEDRDVLLVSDVTRDAVRDLVAGANAQGDSGEDAYCCAQVQHKAGGAHGLTVLLTIELQRRMPYTPDYTPLFA